MDKENNVFYWLPCSVVFVCTAHEEMRDIMTATAMFVSEKEPLLAISVAQGHFATKLVTVYPGNRARGRARSPHETASGGRPARAAS